MPFTLSHPAATLVVAPLLGRFAVPSALVIGAMTPDFPYFVAAPIPRMTIHTLNSVLWFSLPLGWIAYLVFERVLRAPIVHLLPAALRLRLEPRIALAPAFAVTLSLFVGAITHVIWDALTHGAPAAVRELPLRVLVNEAGGTSLLSYRLLQHGSSVAGAALLAIYGLAWVRRTPERARPQAAPLDARALLLARTAMLVVPAIVGLVVARSWAPPVHDLASLAWFGAHVAVSGVTTAVGLLVAGALCLRGA